MRRLVRIERVAHASAQIEVEATMHKRELERRLTADGWVKLAIEQADPVGVTHSDSAWRIVSAAPPFPDTPTKPRRLRTMPTLDQRDAEALRAVFNAALGYKIVGGVKRDLRRVREILLANGIRETEIDKP
jgi:hypothetical protein